MTWYAGREALVTGGAGFVGRHLVEALLASGATVTILDNFLTGHGEGLASRDGLRVIEACVTEPPPPDLEPDIIFNLACPAAPRHYQADPIATWRASVFGADRMTRLALETGARLVQASTSEVYGNPKITPQPETYAGYVEPIGPRACYDEGKRAAETLISDHVRMSNLDGRIARIFNTYGPGMAFGDGRAVPAFILQALRGEPLSVHGDGSQTRSFCHVDDLVRGVMALGAGDGLAGMVVNLGNPSEITILELTRAVCEACGSTSGVIMGDRPVHDPDRRCPDITRATTLLDWRPEVDLATGLASTVTDIRMRLEHEPVLVGGRSRGPANREPG